MLPRFWQFSSILTAPTNWKTQAVRKTQTSMCKTNTSDVSEQQQRVSRDCRESTYLLRRANPGDIMSWWGPVQLLGIQKVIKEGRSQQNSILHRDFVKVISTHPLLRSLLFPSPPAPSTFYYQNPGSSHINGEVNFKTFSKCNSES